MAEYALILFIVAVVCAVGFRFLGRTLGVGMNQASGHLDSPSAQSEAQGGGAGGGGSVGGGGGASVASAGHGTAEDPSSAGFGGARQATQPSAAGSMSLAKVAMIALGLLGAAAAFFAIMKGKHAR